MGALKVYETMCQQEQTPDADTCTSLITACAENNLHNQVVLVFDYMRQHGIGANAVICNEVFLTLQQPEVEANLILYNTLMCAFVDFNQASQAVEAFQMMWHKGL